MQDIKLINFIGLDDSQKKMVLKWRNDPRILNFIKHKSVGTKEHYNFILSLKSQTDKQCFLIKNNNKYTKVIDFINIKDKNCKFGLYANTDLKAKGKRLMDTLGTDTINSCEYITNEKAINLYEKFGFKLYNKDEYSIIFHFANKIIFYRGLT